MRISENGEYYESIMKQIVIFILQYHQVMLLLRFDVKKTVRIFQSFISVNFCEYNNQFAKKLTQSIVSARNDAQLAKLVEQYHGKFNLFNISALLKKVNSKIQRNNSLLDLIYKQVLLSVSTIKKPNIINSRAISNIIGYTGNQSYHGIDQYIKSIDLNQLIKYTNQKQFVMVVTGLLKLKLLQNLVKTQDLPQFLIKHVNENFKSGILISLWRNFIKHGKSNTEINNFFATKINNASPSQHLKDFGYLVYCFTQSYFTLFDSANLLRTIQKYSQNILYTTRVYMFQLCVFIDHLTKLRQIAQMAPNKNFIQLLEHHYIRIIKDSDLNLRTLANGFLSFHNFIQKVDKKIHKLTSQKFVQILIKKVSEKPDYESITSLFPQLITTIEQEDNMTQSQDYDMNVGKQSIKSLQRPILQIFFGKRKRIMEVSDKQFQKLLYGFSLYKKIFPQFQFTKTQLQLICKSVLERNELISKQVSSLIKILGQFCVKEERVCLHLKQVGEKRLKQKQDENFYMSITKPCILGYKSQKCIKCTKKNN